MWIDIKNVNGCFNEAFSSKENTEGLFETCHSYVTCLHFDGTKANIVVEVVTGRRRRRSEVYTHE